MVRTGIVSHEENHMAQILSYHRIGNALKHFTGYPEMTTHTWDSVLTQCERAAPVQMPHHQKPRDD